MSVLMAKDIVVAIAAPIEPKNQTRVKLRIRLTEILDITAIARKSGRSIPDNTFLKILSIPSKSFPPIRIIRMGQAAAYAGVKT